MVPEGVVELLEMVQVDDEQRHRAALVVRRVDGLVQPAQQLAAVRE